LHQSGNLSKRKIVGENNARIVERTDFRIRNNNATKVKPVSEEIDQAGKIFFSPALVLPGIRRNEDKLAGFQTMFLQVPFGPGKILWCNGKIWACGFFQG
jgi:hypothetical protein